MGSRITWADNTNATPLIDIRNFMDTLYRDKGVYNGRWHRHSKNCVYLKDKNGITKWCCAKDCKI